MVASITGQRIRIRGTVQGVGFRPAVWRLANEESLSGEVWNDSEGVVVHAWGSERALSRFIARIQSEAPPLAKIDAIETSPLEPQSGDVEGFRIVESRSGVVATGVAADAATCPDCLSEILDSSDRRYRYPFTNCTHCGPRLSIVRSIPYDRANTSMAAFTMCPACQAEYDDPADRRFHAQPNACPECGPRLWLEDSEGERVSLQGKQDAVAMAASLIAEGKIVAIKGIGGFHLACDAGSELAVTRLRRRKQRYAKAFALMARDSAMVARYARVGEEEEIQLRSSAAPVMVLEQEGEKLPDAVAPGQRTLGFMLPYTPLHHLLMDGLERPIVLTSGNLSHEPQVIDNGEARGQLGQIADYFLFHDRDIVNRLDDSVMRVVAGKPRLLRRARGFAPQPIPLPPSFAAADGVLALGADLKNTFCLLKQGSAMVSQHIGDLEDARTHQSLEENLSLYRNLFGSTPNRIAIDAHPSYHASRYGRALAERESVPLVEVLHHHAHIAAAMVEHGLELDHGKVLGVALDGLGYGEQGELWGGEFLLADYRECRRLGHFMPVPLLGGAQASYEPWRNTFAHLETALGWSEVSGRYGDLELVRYLNNKPVATLQAMIEKGLNSPPASSAGRLFDAVAAALGICRDRAAYEGQAAIELEGLAADVAGEAVEPYGYDEQGGVITWGTLWLQLLDDLKSGVDAKLIAARFHRTIAKVVVDTALKLCRSEGLAEVVLSGGVFQNRLLLEQTLLTLRESGITVYAPVSLPANDGGVALGQAVIAYARTQP